MQVGQITLKPHIYKDFVKPLYDIAGSRELESTSPLHIAVPNDCLVNNLLLQPYTDTDADGKTTAWPSEKNGKDFSCITVHQAFTGSTYSYYNLPPSEPCTTTKIELDGKPAKTY